MHLVPIEPFAEMKRGQGFRTLTAKMEPRTTRRYGEICVEVQVEDMGPEPPSTRHPLSAHKKVSASILSWKEPSFKHYE